MDEVLTTWSYDAIYQLINERSNGTSAYSTTYTYDSVGNRTHAQQDGVLTSYAYDVANRLQTQQDTDGLTTFTYDQNGNLTLRESPQGDMHLTYDAANQAFVIETPGQTVTLTYNALFQRTAKDNGDTYLKFIYDRKRLLAETDENDVTTKSFTSTTGRGSEYGGLISEYDNDSLSEAYPAYDAQWSTRELLDESGNVTASYRNKAFGLMSPASSASWSDMSVDQWDQLDVEGWNNLPVTSTSGPYGFGGQTGYYYDRETDLYLMGGGGEGRYYDPALGRFNTPDPIGFAGGDVNLYRYVSNNPISGIDPSGNQEGEGDEDARTWFESLSWEQRIYHAKTLDVHPSELSHEQRRFVVAFAAEAEKLGGYDRIENILTEAGVFDSAPSSPGSRYGSLFQLQLANNYERRSDKDQTFSNFVKKLETPQRPPDPRQPIIRQALPHEIPEPPPRNQAEALARWGRDRRRQGWSLFDIWAAQIMLPASVNPNPFNPESIVHSMGNFTPGAYPAPLGRSRTSTKSPIDKIFPLRPIDPIVRSLGKNGEFVSPSRTPSPPVSKPTASPGNGGLADTTKTADNVVAPSSRIQRLEELAKDPDHAGKITPKTQREADYILEVEEAGHLKGVKRPSGPDQGDFVDASGRAIDVKFTDPESTRGLSYVNKKTGVSGIQSFFEKTKKAIESGELQLINSRHLTPDQLKEIRTWIKANGFTNDQIRIWP